MSSSVNKIRNADLRDGREGPRGWVWSTTGKQIRWARGRSDRSDQSGRMTIKSGRATGEGWWSQTVACKPGTHYRVEATATCDLTADDPGAGARSVGLILAACPMVEDRPANGRRVTPTLLRASKPVAIRTFYRAPDDARQLKVSVGVVGAKGSAQIHHVRLIEIIEPEEKSHPMSIPLPACAVEVPRVARRVCVCSASGAERPITRRLAEYFGPANVSTMVPEALGPADTVGDALLLPDRTPPPSLRTLAALMKLATKQIVVVSLPAMASLTKTQLSVRRVEQNDDPIHAKATYANHATRGFALEDVLPYAWPGAAIGSFVQNQFRRGEGLKRFCQRHDFVTLLESVCDQDVTSDRPIALYKKTTGGGLYVLDIEPCEADPSTFGEPALALHLLLSVLGQSQHGLGQYTVPEDTEAEFRDAIREMDVRFAPFVVHDADLPTDEITEQLVTIGREDESFGQPLKPKPVILVRSGLTAGDVESVYGSLLWFKQLVRMEPHICPYAEALGSQFRLAWIPLAAPWVSRCGWQRPAASSATETTIALDHAQVALLVDVATCPTNEVGVVLPSHEGVYLRYAEWLPRLAAAFKPGQYFMPAVPDREPFYDRDSIAWRFIQHEIQIIVDPDAFAQQVHRDVLANGGQVVRIEVPGHDADFAAHSIQRTDLAATLLEQVIGLQYGLVAVNRQPTTVHFDRFPPVAPGQALAIDRRNPMLQADASQVG
jgi:hypothetical protein